MWHPAGAARLGHGLVILGLCEAAGAWRGHCRAVAAQAEWDTAQLGMSGLSGECVGKCQGSEGATDELQAPANDAVSAGAKAALADWSGNETLANRVPGRALSCSQSDPLFPSPRWGCQGLAYRAG